MEYSTFKTNLSVIKKLKEYNQDLHFDDITNEWLDGYFSYLMHDLDNNLNTAFKNMATIKNMLRPLIMPVIWTTILLGAGR